MTKQILVTLAVVAAVAIVFMAFIKKGEIETTVPVPTSTSEAELPADLSQHIASKADFIVLTEPIPLSVVTSPLRFAGRARGTWFFEATFPVILVDWDGLIIAESYATAKTDWMTEDFVEFEGTIEFTDPSWEKDFSKRGALIFQKDNPSGLPEHDDALEIPIQFSQ